MIYINIQSVDSSDNDDNSSQVEVWEKSSWLRDRKFRKTFKPLGFDAFDLMIKWDFKYFV